MTPADDAVERPDTEGAVAQLRGLLSSVTDPEDLKWQIVSCRADNLHALLAERDSLLARVRELEEATTSIAKVGRAAGTALAKAYTQQRKLEAMLSQAKVIIEAMPGDNPLATDIAAVLAEARTKGDG